MKKIVLTLSALLLGLFVFTAREAYSDQPTIQPFTCDKGSFLIGFTGNVGAWIDNFTPMCARWDGASGKLVTPPKPGPNFGYSNGGRFQRAMCPNPQAVVYATFNQAVSNHQVNLQNLRMTCADVRTAEWSTDSWHPELMSDGAGIMTERRCFPHEAAIGVEIGFGGDNDLTSISLICDKVDNVRATAERLDHFSERARHVGDGTGGASNGGGGGSIFEKPGHFTHTPFGTAAAGGSGGGGSGGGGSGYPSLGGVWNTNEGQLTLTLSGNVLNGTYPNGGHFQLSNKGGAWNGIWYQNSSSDPCVGNPAAGTEAWGHVSLTFNAQNNHFEGTWGYCTKALSHSWTGDRIN